MTFDITGTLDALESHLSNAAWFDGGVHRGVPTGPPPDDFTAWVSIDEARVMDLTGSGVQEVHVIVASFYMNALLEPVDDLDINLSDAISALIVDLITDYTLGDTMRAVDFAGISGSALESDFAWVELGGVNFRVAFVSVPVIVNDVHAQAA